MFVTSESRSHCALLLSRTSLFSPLLTSCICSSSRHLVWRSTSPMAHQPLAHIPRCPPYPVDQVEGTVFGRGSPKPEKETEVGVKSIQATDYISRVLYFTSIVVCIVNHLALHSALHKVLITGFRARTRLALPHLGSLPKPETSS